MTKRVEIITAETTAVPMVDLTPWQIFLKILNYNGLHSLKIRKRKEKR
jgi:hypothetical protein